MSLAITATVIAGLLFGVAVIMLKDESENYKTHMHDNMNGVIQNEMTSP